MVKNLFKMRTEYKDVHLKENNLDKNPINQFISWFNEAKRNNIIEPNAMILSTIKKNNHPCSRAVLLKEVNNNGFIFFTNYNSNKGKEISHNYNVTLNFLWKKIQKQIIIEGKAKKLSNSISTNYFNSRPRKSKIAAWASNQSEKIENRKVLKDNFKKIEKKFEKIKNIPKPNHWGGYIVLPNKVEFWQGNKSRLHDRICYVFNKNWEKFRLSP